MAPIFARLAAMSARCSRSGRSASLTDATTHASCGLTSTLSRRAVSGAALDDYRDKVAKLESPTGLTALHGPGIRVTLTDAPKSVNPEGVDPNLLVVHQQDIQAFVNALWVGGAEAISLQGQRLISTTGIKCVGNTVVLDGSPTLRPT